MEARSIAFQGLAPLATNPGSSGAGTRNAHDDAYTHKMGSIHDDRNAGTPSNTSTSAASTTYKGPR